MRLPCPISASQGRVLAGFTAGPSMRIGVGPRLKDLHRLYPLAMLRMKDWGEESVDLHNGVVRILRTGIPGR
jgi:hypothetical protein